jgi:hypothetical protein
VQTPPAGSAVVTKQSNPAAQLLPSVHDAPSPPLLLLSPSALPLLHPANAATAIANPERLTHITMLMTLRTSARGSCFAVERFNAM